MFVCQQEDLYSPCFLSNNIVNVKSSFENPAILIGIQTGYLFETKQNDCRVHCLASEINKENLFPK